MDVSFKLTNTLSELNTLEAQLQLLGKRWSLSKKIEAEVNLVLEELVTNIITHGDQDHSRTIEIHISKHERQLTIIIEDDGPPFNPTLTASPDTTLPLEKRECGGLGIHFVCQFTDRREYKRSGDKNIFTMRKILPKECGTQ